MDFDWFHNDGGVRDVLLKRVVWVDLRRGSTDEDRVVVMMERGLRYTQTFSPTVVGRKWWRMKSICDGS